VGKFIAWVNDSTTSNCVLKATTSPLDFFSNRFVKRAEVLPKDNFSLKTRSATKPSIYVNLRLPQTLVGGDDISCKDFYNINLAKRLIFLRSRFEKKLTGDGGLSSQLSQLKNESALDVQIRAREDLFCL
jgi:hypothetical protein